MLGRGVALEAEPAQGTFRRQGSAGRTKHQGHLRGIVPSGLSRGPGHPAPGAPRLGLPTQHRRQVPRRQGAVPEQAGLGSTEVHHGALQARPAGTAIKDEIDPVAQVRTHMRRGGGTHMLGSVGAGGGQGPAEGPEEHEGQGMVGHPQRHRGPPGRDRIRHLGPPRQHQGEGPGPERLHEAQGGGRQRCDEILGHLDPGDMEDERVGRRTALGREDAGQGGGVQGVRAQAVHRFRGEGHEAPAPEEDHGLVQPRVGRLGTARAFHRHGLSSGAGRPGHRGGRPRPRPGRP